jgi:hypothetical protein
MIGSEMFLDSSQLRESVVSHAKELNYVPRSFTSASAHISFDIYPNTALNSILVPKGTTFSTKMGSNSYTFSTQENLIFNTNSNGTIVVDDLEIFEGNYLTDTFVYTSSNTAQRFILSNPTVDTRSISVVVIENNGANTLSYNRSLSFLGVTANSKVYFLQAAENSQYEIVFGDGTIGSKPLNGSTIVVEYRVCNGELPNGVSDFAIDGPIQSQTNISSISVLSPAVGGSVGESNESIKFNAPRYYQNQERAVTTSDYENILTQYFPEIQAISAYGGDEALPPQYGKVYIAIDIKNADGVPEVEKRKFYNFIKPRSPLSIDPVIVDPEFLFCSIDTSVTYNINTTSIKDSDIRSLVAMSISKFNNENLNNFKSTLRYSKFLKAIDDTHPSILSNETVISPFKVLQPIRGVPFSKTIDFSFELESNDIQSIPETELHSYDVSYNVRTSTFKLNNIECFLGDDGKGTLYATKVDGAFHKRLFKAGTVDYATGTIIIPNLVVDDFTGSEIKLFVSSKRKDIFSEKNVILSIRDSDVTVTVTPLRV